MQLPVPDGTGLMDVFFQGTQAFSVGIEPGSVLARTTEPSASAVAMANRLAAPSRSITTPEAAKPMTPAIQEAVLIQGRLRPSVEGGRISVAIAEASEALMLRAMSVAAATSQKCHDWPARIRVRPLKAASK